MRGWLSIDREDAKLAEHVIAAAGWVTTGELEGRRCAGVVPAVTNTIRSSHMLAQAKASVATYYQMTQMILQGLQWLPNRHHPDTTHCGARVLCITSGYKMGIV